MLINVTAYAELVLDQGWEPDRLVFDPFFGGAALDLWGYADPPTSAPNEGEVVFAAEAKSRVGGADGLQRLLDAFDRLAEHPDASVTSGHRRKWDELLRLATPRPVELLLVAEGARWWFVADATSGRLRLDRIDGGCA